MAGADPGRLPVADGGPGGAWPGEHGAETA